MNKICKRIMLGWIFAFCILTHSCRVDSATSTLWTGLYPIAGCLVRFYYYYSKTCVRQPPLKLILVADVERWLSYKGTCHVILLAKLHDMYLYKTGNFFHINH